MLLSLSLVCVQQSAFQLSYLYTMCDFRQENKGRHMENHLPLYWVNLCQRTRKQLVAIINSCCLFKRSPYKLTFLYWSPCEQKLIQGKSIYLKGSVKHVVCRIGRFVHCMVEKKNLLQLKSKHLKWQSSMNKMRTVQNN